MKNLIFCVLCVFGLSTVVTAQEEDGFNNDDYLIIEIMNGEKYKGNYVSEDEMEIVIAIFELGNTTFEKKFIKKIDKIALFQLKDGKYYFENPLYSKYYVSESAISLKEGEAFYQNLQIFINSFAYGVSDNFTISGGFETISLFEGEFPGFYVSPKFTFGEEESDIHFGVGANLATYQFDELFGSVYGMTTLGDKNNNITLGVGFGFIGSDFEETAVFNLSGMTRLSRRFGLVADIFHVSGETLGGVTLRYMSENVAFDIGGAFADGGALPLIGVTIKF